MKIWLFLFVGTGFILLVTSLEVILYELLKRRDDEINPEWEERIRNTKVCNEIDGGMQGALDRAFARSYLEYFGQVGLAYGAYVGVIV